MIPFSIEAARGWPLGVKCTDQSTNCTPPSIPNVDVQVSWINHGDLTVSGIQIQRSVNGGSYSTVHTASQGTTSWHDTGAGPSGSTVKYRARYTFTDGSAPTDWSPDSNTTTICG